MHIFIWFLIIALIAFAVNLLLLLFMKKKKKGSTAPIFGVVCASYAAAALLYVFTASNGEQVLDQTRTVSLSIEPKSYQTASSGGHTAFAFYSTEGILFQFDDSSLLQMRAADVPKLPETVEVYYCNTCEGYTWCFLRENTALRYVLK